MGFPRSLRTSGRRLHRTLSLSRKTAVVQSGTTTARDGASSLTSPHPSIFNRFGGARQETFSRSAFLGGSHTTTARIGLTRQSPICRRGRTLMQSGEPPHGITWPGSAHPLPHRRSYIMMAIAGLATRHWGRNRLRRRFRTFGESRRLTFLLLPLTAAYSQGQFCATEAAGSCPYLVT